MRLLPGIFLLVFSAAVVSCSATREGSLSHGYVIRYINLNSVYEYVWKDSSEVRELKRKLDLLEKKISDMENSESGGPRAELISSRTELAALREQEKKVKAELYLKIKKAVMNIAARHKADFILNTGDGVVYSKPAYDLTGEVIEELKSFNERTSPVFK
jgi:Skp family chaperone for outer membrane proteins